MRIHVDVEIEQLERQKERPVPSRFSEYDTLSTAVAEAILGKEIFYRAHIEILGGGSHHGEAPTAAQALVNAALHWERHERRK